MVKKISVILLFSFLSSVIAPGLCFPLEYTVARETRSPHLNGPHHSHQQAPGSHDSHHKTPCSTNHFCCNLINQSITPYSFVLDFHLLDPVEFFYKPLLISKLFYHPPQTHL